MSRYDDYRSSTGTLDSRDRHDRYSRGPPVVDRPRHAEERFEDRFREEERYGPPARAPGRIYEDDHLDYPSPAGSVVAHDRRRRRDDSPSFRRPQLLRRQSSLDTFDRIPRRKMEQLDARDLGPPPSPCSSCRYREREVYEDIRIAEPDYYGDEEFRDIRERDMVDRRRRSSSAARRHHEEKPYPRKGRTRIPRHLAHVHAILDLGYPFKEEDDVIVIQKALSKEQIDEVLSLSREFRRPSPVQTEYLRLPESPPLRPRERVTTEHLRVQAPSPRTTHEAFIVEASPSRHRSRSRHGLEYDDYEDYYEEITERPRVRAISRGPQRRRAVSVNDHGRLAPVQYVEQRETDYSRAGPMVLVRPRDSDDMSEYVRQLEEETRLLRLERQGGIEITRQRETDIIDSHGNEEEITEVRKQERSEPNSRLVRAMMATLT
ncbi:uncharacterized protein N7515_007831 [Penicillium bovifimosum]|uniref:DUF8035 domain-containing protein n=1 Tax=Penicillium bovifimosum TaxID=126998 RepID=A0A9W9GLX2_9EURO|nr:uncharacterized protein N7515_007831 [Penicillium bovifimosum]KAJ5124006.1 hypothetical protein N7515_007831 [Penicillium bovifimosum]